jgi:23S rRNA (guanosine2251-2'-O)-methyltransferase
MVARKDRKPTWVVDKERTRNIERAETVWLFGIHAVRDALMNPAREKLELIVTKNASDRLSDAIAFSGMSFEPADPRKFSAPLDPGSVHQGVALEVKPLGWGDISNLCAPRGQNPLVLMLDRVSDPHNVGAILRSAEVFGARAIIAPQRHSAPETGALAKTASGALERQPYLRVTNLSDAMKNLRDMGYLLIGLDGEADATLTDVLNSIPVGPTALVLGAEGPGLRDKTKDTCDMLARIPFHADFGSLNVSNAAAIGLFASRQVIDASTSEN